MKTLKISPGKAIFFRGRLKTTGEGYISLGKVIYHWGKLYITGESKIRIENNEISPGKVRNLPGKNKYCWGKTSYDRGLALKLWGM